ncbi:MAG: hypothetical protein ACPGJS_13990 [Flammeovirgaceae bacterium]
MRYLFIILILFIASVADAQVDSLTRKRAVRIVDFNHPKNKNIQDLPQIIFNATAVSVLKAIEPSNYLSRVSTEDFLERLQLTGFDPDNHSRSYFKKFKKMNLEKYQEIHKAKLVIEEVYDQDGKKITKEYSHDTINDYQYKHPPKIKTVVFLDKEGKELIAFYYIEIAVNVMFSNPECEYKEKGKVKYYVDVFEKERYHYTEVKE